MRLTHRQSFFFADFPFQLCARGSIKVKAIAQFKTVRFCGLIEQ
jgi:hypothetical protein